MLHSTLILTCKGLTARISVLTYPRYCSGRLSVTADLAVDGLDGGWFGLSFSPLYPYGINYTLSQELLPRQDVYLRIGAKRG
ncbi:hypothetical protein GDO78_020396 [Eleutherodactylus coqui]|uniref:Uncharacterized protein n=1 Tax=Eleutherodactylus coqui TaxID=57060 RepID=A0A8J6AYV9_ELECQ|nr:hypothetical protein GDO78_020396 [Eleutherodactylus coqui]